MCVMINSFLYVDLGYSHISLGKLYRLHVKVKKKKHIHLYTKTTYQVIIIYCYTKIIPEKIRSSLFNRSTAVSSQTQTTQTSAGCAAQRKAEQTNGEYVAAQALERHMSWR